MPIDGFGHEPLCRIRQKRGRKSTVVSLRMRHFALEENAEVLDSGGERDASYASHIGLMMIDRVGEKDMACDA